MGEIVELKSFPFNSVKKLNEEGVLVGDRKYPAEVFQGFFEKVLSKGIYITNYYKDYGENALKVTIDEGLSVRVHRGAGFLGTDFEHETDSILTLNSTVGKDRVDRIVIRRDNALDERRTTLYVKEGNGNILADIERNEDVYEICIAEVTIRDGKLILNSQDIKDTRYDLALCGIVNSLIQLDYQEVLDEFQSYVREISLGFEADIDNLKDNIVLKNEDSIIKGSIKVEGGITGDVKGNLEGNASTSNYSESSDHANTARKC